MPNNLIRFLKNKIIINTLLKYKGRTKTIIGLSIMCAVLLFTACWFWYIVAAAAILWEFFGQSINAESGKYYYNVNETVDCKITYHVSQSNKYIEVHIIDDVTNDTIHEGIISPLSQYGYKEEHYTGYSTDYPGYFKCHAQIRTWGSKSMGWQGSSFLFGVSESAPTYPNTLNPWCGNNVKGNPGERLQIEVKTAHNIAVQIEGTDHSSQVLFTTNAFGCTFEWSGASSIPKNQEQITIDGQIIYIARTWVKLPTDQPPAGEYFAYYILARQQDIAPNDVVIPIFSIIDGEKSHNIGSYSHQTYYLGEIPGDNYINTLDTQGNIVDDPGGSSNYKDIMIELDWYKWNNDVNSATIEAIAESTKKILYTAGIDTLNSIFIGNEITNMPDATIRLQRMSLLYDNKSPITDDQRKWRNKIHVILGSTESDINSENVFGIVEEHSMVEGGASWVDWLWYTMHMGSGSTDYTKAFLDSTGCFIFAKKVVDYLAPLSPRPTDIEAIALATAHEIGHTLGMWHVDGVQAGKNVMIESFYDPYHSGTGFRDYGKFSPKSLNGDYDINGYFWDGMNTRHVIGVNTVNMRE